MHDTLHEIKQNLLGPLSVGYYISAFLFSLMGAYLMIYARSSKRDKSSPATPVHFSFKFLLWDTAPRALATMIAMFMLYRFSSEFLHEPLSMRLAVGIGFFISMGVTYVIEFLQDRSELLNSLLSRNRDKYMQNQVDKVDSPPPAAATPAGG